MPNTTKKKTGKKDSKAKNSSEQLLKEIKSKLKSTKKKLQRQVDDLTVQVKKLSKDPSKSAKKLIKSLEQSYQEQIAKLRNGVEDGVESLQSLQEKAVAHLPDELAEKLHLKPKSRTKIAKESLAEASNALKQTAKKLKAPTLSSIKGIGPAMQKKLQEAGVTSLEDLVNPPASKMDALKQFAKGKNFDSWRQQAKELLGKND